MEDQSSKPEFAKASQQAPKPEKKTALIKKAKIKPEPRHSHHQTLDKIELYITVAKHHEHQKHMIDLRDTYKNRQQQLDRSRYQGRTYNLIMGLQAGLHPEYTLAKEATQNKLADQHRRTRLIARAKSYYRQNFGMSKSFEKAKTQTKIKNQNKTMDKE